MSAPMVWKLIREPNLHGLRCSDGDSRFVKVLRAYPNDWRVFKYVDGAILTERPHETLAYGKAVAYAWAWLRSGSVTT